MPGVAQKFMLRALSHSRLVTYGPRRPIAEGSLKQWHLSQKLHSSLLPHVNSLNPMAESEKTVQVTTDGSLQTRET